MMLTFCLLDAFDILSFFDLCDFKIYTSFNNLEICKMGKVCGLYKFPEWCNSSFSWCLCRNLSWWTVLYDYENSTYRGKSNAHGFYSKLVLCTQKYEVLHRFTWIDLFSTPKKFCSKSQLKEIKAGKYWRKRETDLEDLEIAYVFWELRVLADTFM